MSEEIALTINRTFDAPIQMVWNAWTDKEQMSKWSCPDTFVITFSEGELVVGGKWRSGMKNDEMGYEGNLQGEYLEIDPPKHLKFTHAWEADSGLPTTITTITVDLVEVNGKTEMAFMQTGFDSEESKTGHESGWSECFNKLEQLLTIGR